jgi:serine phosphatase RsbU (regulator of sigma subunit)
MTYRSAILWINAALTLVGSLVLAGITLLFSRDSLIILALIVGPLFILFFFVRRLILKAITEAVRRKRFDEGDTGLLTAFLNSMRVCFTINDFLEAIKTKVEREADGAVIFLQSSTGEVVYASPDTITSDPATTAFIRHHYGEWSEGVYFIDQEIGLVSSYRKSRGFFIVTKDYQFWVFLRYCKLIEPDAFESLRKEFGVFIDRVRTVDEMFTISALSKEWDLIAETQDSFLPRAIPDLKKLDIATYYRPLVNVSGDYYDIIKIDEDKTLVVLGDVSGKGLAAALIMGIIICTIRITEDKKNLRQILLNVDAAIKGMRFEDKYTVIFIGLIDTAEKKMAYVNASMADPLVISQTATGLRVRPIESNNSLVGLIPLDDPQVDEIPIRTGDVILIASDGVSEVPNDEGVQLGDSELYVSTIKKASAGTAQEVVDTVSSLVLRYAGDRKLRDDVTMLVAKVGKLWD